MNRRRFLSWAAHAAMVARVPRVGVAFSSALKPYWARQDERNVRDFGALGDGKADDTPAFARCIGSLTSSGGIVSVPSGLYNIDPRRSVVLIDNVELRLATTAVLRAMPVREKQSAVVRALGATNVVVSGGTVVGERSHHQGVGGEWGMGIELRGCTNARLYGLVVSDCWGDGIYVGAFSGRDSQAVTIQKCTSKGNRRQGLSVTGCVTGLVEDCQFSGTEGTPPQAGIDIEPNGSSAVRNFAINRCIASNNAGPGIALSGVNVSGVSLTATRSFNNLREGILIDLAGGSVLQGNTVEKNGRSGIRVMDHADRTAIVGNAIRCNGQSFPGRFDNVMLDSGATDTLISTNTFLIDSACDDGVRYDLNVNSPDCLRTRISGNQYRVREGGRGGLKDRGSLTEILPR